MAQLSLSGLLLIEIIGLIPIEGEADDGREGDAGVLEAAEVISRGLIALDELGKAVCAAIDRGVHHVLADRALA